MSRFEGHPYLNQIIADLDTLTGNQIAIPGLLSEKQSFLNQEPFKSGINSLVSIAGIEVNEQVGKLEVDKLKETQQKLWNQLIQDGTFNVYSWFGTIILDAATRVTIPESKQFQASELFQEQIIALYGFPSRSPWQIFEHRSINAGNFARSVVDAISTGGGRYPKVSTWPLYINRVLDQATKVKYHAWGEPRESAIQNYNSRLPWTPKTYFQWLLKELDFNNPFTGIDIFLEELEYQRSLAPSTGAYGEVRQNWLHIYASEVRGPQR